MVPWSPSATGINIAVVAVLLIHIENTNEIDAMAIIARAGEPATMGRAISHSAARRSKR